MNTVMKTIFRVEHSKTRTGPFRTPAAYDVMCHYAISVVWSLPEMTSPRHAGFSHDDPERKFAKLACESKSQLARWFPAEVRCRLDALGFVVSTYSVKKTLASDEFQCMAWLKYKRPVAIQSLSEFFS